MRKAWVFALALLAVPALVQAQRGPGGPGMMAQANVAKLLLENRETISLTDEQVVKLEAVAKTLDEKNGPVLEEMRKAREAGGDRQAMMASMQKIRGNSDEAFEKEIKPVLTAEQVTKAEKVIADARPQRRGGGGR